MSREQHNETILTSVSQRMREAAGSLSNLRKVVPVQLMQKLRRNPDLWRSLMGAFVDGDPESRTAHLNRTVFLVLEKMLAPEVEKGRDSAVGVAQTFVTSTDWNAFQLNRIPHLGALSPLGVVVRNRCEYAFLILGILLQIKQHHPQLGLGSGSGVQVAGKDLTKLEVAQMWALTANAGHLFGTFATERALLAHVAADASVRDRLLAGIDPMLRGTCATIVADRRMHRFFYVMAAWRASRLQGQNREIAVSCLRAFIDRPARLKRARWAYDRARQLASDKIHYFSGIGGLVTALVGAQSGDVVDRLHDRNGLALHEHSADGNELLSLLDAHARYQHWAIFSSPKSTRLVEDHVIQFNRWWDTHTKSDEALDTILLKLFATPPDWPTSREHTQHRFLRVELPGRETDWLAESIRWKALASQGSTGESEWHAFVSPTPGVRHLTCDIYDDGRLNSPALRCIAENLAAICGRMPARDPAQNRVLWRSYARFGARLLEIALKPEFRVILQSVPTGDDRVGYCILADSPAEALRRLKDYLSHLEVETRRRELEAVQDRLAADISANVLADAPVLVFLANVKILDSRTQIEHRELDGVWAEILEDGVKWHVLEHKSNDRTGASQLRKLNGNLRRPAAEPREVLVSAGRASQISFRWPPEDATSGDLVLCEVEDGAEH
ncbi:MAG: hypothetical protein GXP55_23370 [Deltaproteobacteria bacterium]|nr:hypothetical protein [Deltaproteobacteria bacterium]